MPGHDLPLRAVGREKNAKFKISVLSRDFSISPTPLYTPTYTPPEGEWSFNESHDTLLSLLTLVLALTHSAECHYSPKTGSGERKTKTRRWGKERERPVLQRKALSPDHLGFVCSLRCRLNPAFSVTFRNYL